MRAMSDAPVVPWWVPAATTAPSGAVARCVTDPRGKRRSKCAAGATHARNSNVQRHLRIQVSSQRPAGMLFYDTFFTTPPETGGGQEASHIWEATVCALGRRH